MKKFWNLMLAALVVLGAVACTETGENLDAPKGLSFEATIDLAETRTDVVFNEDTGKWDTVWTGNETLTVKSGWNAYDFKNSVDNKNRFVCTNDGVKSLVGKSVEIFLTHDAEHNTLNSMAGKAGGKIRAEVDSFDPAVGVDLQVESAFLRYSSTSEVTLDASSYIFDYNGNVHNTITLPAGEDVWVAVKTADDVTLSYSIDGEKCKEKVINIAAKKIYNLGELAPVVSYEQDATWGIAGDFNGWVAGTPEPLYIVDNMLVAFNLTGLNNGFKFVQNKGWDGAKGSKVTSAVANGEWLYCGDNNITAADAAAYDVYFVPARSMYCLVAAGSAAPELPAVESIVWSLAGSFNNWGDTLMTATDTANLFVVKGVELKSGDEIKIKDSKTWDTSYGGGINNLEANKWMKAYFNGSNIVVAKSGSYDVYFEYAEGAEYSKLYLIEADADYTAATEQTANGTLVPDGGSEPEQPEVTPGEKSEWALVGAFSSWADKTMLTTTDANVVVLENVAIKAAEGFLVRKPATDWADKYGAGNVNYIKTNHYIVTSKDGADMCLEADGTYDIYFNSSTKNLYVMTAGTDYATATQQTVSGEEPKQEEPEVTEKVVYLKPNSNWTQSNARFAAYFFGGSVGEKWVSMTACGDGTYEVHLPEGYDYGCSIIFCRMNPSTTANNWNNKWNQTADLNTPTDGKNLYTVKDGTWDKGGGTWSVK